MCKQLESRWSSVLQTMPDHCDVHLLSMKTMRPTLRREGYVSLAQSSTCHMFYTQHQCGCPDRLHMYRMNLSKGPDLQAAGLANEYLTSGAVSADITGGRRQWPWHQPMSRMVEIVDSQCGVHCITKSLHTQGHRLYNIIVMHTCITHILWTCV